MPTTQNLDLYRGDSKLLTVLVKDLLGAPFDFTAEEGGDAPTAKYWIARNPDSIGDDVLVLKSTAVDDGITIATPTTGGVITIQLSKNDTDQVPGLFYHELKVWKGTDVATSMKGIVNIHAALSMPPGLPLFADALAIGSPEFGVPALSENAPV